MDRRDFIKASTVFAIVAGGSSQFAQVAGAQSGDAFNAAFADPTSSADLWIIWHWNNRTVTAEGLTADLESMARSGISTVTMFSIGESDFDPPSGPDAPGADQDSLSPKWWSHVEHAIAECDRLGLKMNLQVCDGWGTAGGPWIEPENAMQRIAWTQTDIVGGARFRGKLTQAAWSPLSELQALHTPDEAKNYYRDVATLAFPVPDGWGKSSHELNPALTTSLPITDLTAATSPDNRASVVETTEAGYLQFAFAEPFTLRSVRVDTRTEFVMRPHIPPLYMGYNRPAHSLSVEASNDGENFHKVGQLEPAATGWQAFLGAVEHPIPETTARYFRLVHEPAAPVNYDDNYNNGSSIDGSDATLAFTNISLSSTPGVRALQVKSAEIYGLSKPMTSTDIPAQSCIAPQDMVDLTSMVGTDGSLDWMPPTRQDWRIVRIGAICTGTTNAPAGAARGLEADKLSATAARLQYEGWFGAIRDRAGERLARTVLNGVFIDSWECGSQNWTANFSAEFERRRGYDITRYLPAMCGIPVGDGGTTERFLCDVRTTIGELLVDTFMATMKELAERDGVVLAGELTSPIITSDGMWHHSQLDFPTGEFWVETETNWKVNDVADAVSAAHVYGNKVSMAEAFTGGDWNIHPRLIRRIGDQNFIYGINRFMLHVWQQQPDETLPGPPGAGTAFNRHNVWWEAGQAWREYLRRCHTILQRGVPVVGLAYFTGEDMPRRALVRPDEGVVFTTDHEPPAGFTFDSVNRDALLRLAQIEDGNLAFPGGVKYQALILQDDRRMTPEVSMRLEELVEAGLTLIGPPPAHSPSLSGGGDADAQVNRIALKLWGDLSEPRDEVRTIGRGKVIWPVSLENGLSIAGVQPDLMVTGLSDAATGRLLEEDPSIRAGRTTVGPERTGGRIQWNHRALPEGEFYFISNQEPFPVRFEFNVPAVEDSALECFEPVAGEVHELVASKRNGDRLEVPLTLPAGGSTFIVLRKGRMATRLTLSGGEGAEVYGVEGQLMASATRAGEWTIRSVDGRENRLVVQSMPDPLSISGTWEVAFDLPDGGEEIIRMSELSSWTENPNDRIKHFSGTARYRIAFDASENLIADDLTIHLDLGAVEGLGRVNLNGVDLGVLWTTPYRVELPKSLLRRSNLLEIAVTNSWHNAVLAARNSGEESAPTLSFSEPSNELQTSGLLGPVVISPVRVEKIALG